MKKASFIILQLFCLVVFLSFTANAQSNCTYEISPTTLNVPPESGNYSLIITTQNNCSWTVRLDTSVFPRPINLVFTSPTSSIGNGRIDFRVAENFSGWGLSGRINVNGVFSYVNQDNKCSNPFLTPQSVNVPREGVTRASLTGNPYNINCSVGFRSNDSWIVITEQVSNSINYSVAANSGTARTGTITGIFGGALSTYQKTATFTVNQATGQLNCTYSIAPTSIQASAAGGDTGFNITSQPGCNWTAQSNANWIAVLTSSGTNSGRVNYSIQPNNSTEARTGMITVSGQTFTINQDGVAAPVEIITGSGRVMSANGKPVRGAIVTFTRAGETLTTTTNQFGYFHLRVERGQTYNVTISHKRYKFSGARSIAYFTGSLIQIITADAEQ